MLPVEVSKTSFKTQKEIKINCLESDDLQGFKPLAKSQIGAVSNFKPTLS